MAIPAPSLVRLRNALDAKWPNRDRSSDGWIGDTSHQTSGRPENGGSDHNPNYRDVVDARDITTRGLDPMTVVKAAIAHPATNYVIYNRVIWTRSNGFRPARYTGDDPHDTHIHVSIMQTVAAEQNTAPWDLGGGGTPTPTPGPAPSGWAAQLCASLPELSQGMDSASVNRMQAVLNTQGAGLVVDGAFGPRTAAALRAFQSRAGIGVDAICGPQTWGRLLGGPVELRRPVSNGSVSAAQCMLNRWSYGLDVDGDFGPKTEAAVKGVQSRLGLDVDGVVGPQTWRALLTR